MSGRSPSRPSAPPLSARVLAATPIEAKLITVTGAATRGMKGATSASPVVLARHGAQVIGRLARASARTVGADPGELLVATPSSHRGRRRGSALTSRPSAPSTTAAPSLRARQGTMIQEELPAAAPAPVDFASPGADPAPPPPLPVPAPRRASGACTRIRRRVTFRSSWSRSIGDPLFSAACLDVGSA